MNDIEKIHNTKFLKKLNLAVTDQRLYLCPTLKIKKSNIKKKIKKFTLYLFNFRNMSNLPKLLNINIKFTCRRKTPVKFYQTFFLTTA